MQRWLRNKTADNFCLWLQNPECHLVVAELNSEVCGVGMVRVSGDLDLCYIQPGKERLGIGAAILRALEAQAARWSLNKLQLISTANARFFLRASWLCVCRGGICSWVRRCARLLLRQRFRRRAARTCDVIEVIYFRIIYSKLSKSHPSVRLRANETQLSSIPYNLEFPQPCLT